MRTEYWMNSSKNSSLSIPEEAMAYYSIMSPQEEELILSPIRLSKQQLRLN